MQAGPAYDKSLPFLGEFQSSKGEVNVARLKCGQGKGLYEIRGRGGRAVGR